VDWYTAGCCSCGHISGHPEQTLKHLFSVGFVLGFVVIGGLGVDVKPVVFVACNRYLQLLGNGKLCLETVHGDEAKVEWILAR